MNSYYANQALSLPQFSVHYHLEENSFGSLAAGIGNVALPIARRFIFPTEKPIGKKLLS